MFGVKFGDLAKLVKKVGEDHDLAVRLWDTKNCDARTLALKLADPARMSSADLHRWLKEVNWGMQLGYLSMLASEGPHASTKAAQWSASSDENAAIAGWALIGQMALRDAETPDSFSPRASPKSRSGSGP